MQTLKAPPASAYLAAYPPPQSPPATAATPVPTIGVALAPASPPNGTTSTSTSIVPQDDDNLRDGSDIRDVNADPFDEGNGAGESPDDGMATGAIVGLAVAAVAILGVLLLIAGIFIRKRRQRGKAQHGAAEGTAAGIDPANFVPDLKQGPVSGGSAEQGGYYAMPPHMPGPWAPFPPGHAAAQTAGSSAPVAQQPNAPHMSVYTGSAGTTVTAFTRDTWADFAKAADRADSPMDELEVALDGMCGMAQPFYGRYLLLSAVVRRVGGQGLVQFAKVANTQDQAVIKFYMDQKAFHSERQLYTESQLKAMMPATLAIEENASGDCRTPYGYVFPPFVVIERGQSLDEWARSNKNTDFITIFQALSHAVRALMELHSFGYAHRDIKPGNILRRPKQHDWTLIDFGCTAQIGSTASLMFSLKCAAPEVVHALEAGSRTIVADAAVDIWAIGVIAYELLTGERAFPVHGLSAEESEAAAQEAIAGRVPLPWEGGSEEALARLDKLRGIRRTVLQCLERDPAKRPTSEALLQAWDQKFDNMQSRGTFLHAPPR